MAAAAGWGSTQPLAARVSAVGSRPTALYSCVEVLTFQGSAVYSEESKGQLPQLKVCLLVVTDPVFHHCYRGARD